METLNLTKSELAVIAGIEENPQKKQSVINKAKKALGLSFPISQDNSIENFVKRIMFYIGKNDPDAKETELTGKWLKMLAKRAELFLKVNGLQPSETLAIDLSKYKAKEFKELFPKCEQVFHLYRGIRAFINKEYPKEDTFKGRVINTIFTILYVIDGRFGKHILKPKFRNRWRILTYGTIIALFFIYVFIPFMNWCR